MPEAKYKSTTDLLIEIDKNLIDPNNNTPRLGSWEGDIDSEIAYLSARLA